MRTLTILYGTALGTLGIGGYIASKRASKTALIPAGFGIPIALLGVASIVPGARTAALGTARVLATLGLAGSARGITKLPQLLDGSAERPMAVASQSAMAALSLAYLLASAFSK